MMGPILLLTKNVLAEEETQKKLQHLNYEVFSSSSLLTKRGTQGEFLQFFNLFYYTIISETISDIELQQLLPILRKSTTTLIRKNDHANENQQDFQVKLWISNESSIEELRELLIGSNTIQGFTTSGALLTSQPKPQEMETNQEFGIKQSLSDLRLSRLEMRILNALYSANSQIVSRDELCHQTWEGDITNSRLVMLSNLIRKLKEKLQLEGFPEHTIRTHWGKGYQLTQRFYDYFEADQVLEEIEESLQTQEEIC